VSTIKKKIIRLFILIPVALGLMLFLPAGTLCYWQAWAFIATLIIPLAFVILYFLKHDPDLLERRLRYKEKERRERVIIAIGNFLFLAGLLAPGFDRRFGWSHMPAWLSIVADAVIFASYMFVFRVYRENSYASRILEIQQGQKVIDTGPYAAIRHPMYAGIIAMYLSIPLALGSYISLAFFVPVISLIFVRIFDEERLLLKDLPGYKDYTERVRYRLIPRIW
jgi:protein-S-isoprenylcysteine O-methyltransferase Ste14